MASAQQMLAATSDLQQNAQAALPVIPNNGNPGGAYNMPQNGQAPAAKPAGPDLSWLQPSEHMQTLNKTLQSIQQSVEASKNRMPRDTQITPPRQVQPAMAPVLPQYTQPAVAAPQGVVLPTLR